MINFLPNLDNFVFFGEVSEIGDRFHLCANLRMTEIVICAKYKKFEELFFHFMMWDKECADIRILRPCLKP